MTETYISDQSIRRFSMALFAKIGVSKKTAKDITVGLVETSLRGVDSHGIRLLPHYIRAFLVGRINKTPKFIFKKTAISTGILNADHGHGIASGIAAMQKAIELAKKSGIGAVAVKNSTHFGAAAIYSLLAAKTNMIGLSFTHTDSLVLPFGSKKPFLGTNPICFAAPCSGEEPFCLDMATSQVAWNKILIYRSNKKILEAGWAADISGRPSIDPNKVSALLPMGIYKGYGLALMIEILCSLLTGMAFGPHIKRMYPLNKEKRYLGHFFVAIDIAKFESIRIFKRRLKKLMNELRAYPVLQGIDKVRVAGDPEKEIYAIRSKNGIPLSSDLVHELINIGIKVGVDKSYLI